ncbi:MAG: hypothetical protein M1479_10060 [Actinobacteria bacterium]|nr:hypothetical protein [Actinomycetota bacterium]
MNANKEVFILGSGFSKAIIDDIPLLNELSTEIEKKIYSASSLKDEYKFIYEKYIKNKGFNNFEDILTYLYQSFSWKNNEEYFLLKSLFFYITNLLVDVFLEKEEILKEKLMQKKENSYELHLLENLINYFNYTNSSIITFNYDTILEYLCLNIFKIKSPVKIYHNDWDKIDVKEIFFFKDYQRKFTDNDKIIDLQLDESNDNLIVYYNNFPHPDEAKFPYPDTLKNYTAWYYDENFKSKFGEIYKKSFIGSYTTFFREQFQQGRNKIQLEDLYQMPFSRIASRTSTLWGGSEFRQTLRILKLHGSINWYYSPSKSESNQIYLKSSDPRLEKIDEISKKDLQPLIMPPLLDKSDFSSLNSIKTIWQEVRNFLKEAENIYIIGYSLPDSDTTIKLLLKTSLDNCKRIFLINIEIIIEEKIKILLNPSNEKINPVIKIENKIKNTYSEINFNQNRLKIIGFYPEKEILDKEYEKIIFKFIEKNIPDYCLQMAY